MAKEIRKNNALTDANKIKNNALTKKALNAVYRLYEEQGEKIETTTYHILKMLDIGTDKKNYTLILKALKNLLQPITFEDSKQIITAPICTYVRIDKDTKKMNISINQELLQAIRNTPHWTVLSLKIMNRLSGSYAISIYEIYQRYKTVNYKNAKFGKQYDLKEMQEKFNVKLEARKINESIKRGIAEIKKKLDLDIEFFYSRPRKKFCFFWYLSEKELEQVNKKKSQ